MTEALTLLRTAKRPAFLFSGGATRCVFQVGVVETLYSLGIEPKVCLGVSSGGWNAAAVAVGNWRRLRHYWKFFSRMPYVDVTNLLREHSPFIWPKLQARSFARYVGLGRLRSAETLPLFISMTRLRDKKNVILDIRQTGDPFAILLASNYLPPFYTHTPVIDGERYGDGGWSDNLPYETLFERGCDAVVAIASKGESEGGLYRNLDDYNHEIRPEYRDRVVVIRPRHRMPARFVERRWEKLRLIADLGALRAREVLLGERHEACDLAAKGPAISSHFSKFRDWVKERRRQVDG